MIVASCPLRVSLFGGSTDSIEFVQKYRVGSVISFTPNLRTYVTISQDKFGANGYDNRYVVNYSVREEVSSVDEISNDIVRLVLKHFDVEPIQISLTSDVYSHGSGLASSSSYVISMIKAVCIFKGIEMTDAEICSLAHSIELMINPHCGYQDPYGCGISGFKMMNFFDNGRVTYEFLPTTIFNDYDFSLVFTGVTRSSTEILKEIASNPESSLPILDILDNAYDRLTNNDNKGFVELINDSWAEKKKTSKDMVQNSMVKQIDDYLTVNTGVLAHKLCGAGNGGFFLVASQKNSLKIPHRHVNISLSVDGIKGGVA